ncbi:MAG: hypothetical protein WCY05_02030 [Candidatus Omnitrophota bacterium]
MKVTGKSKYAFLILALALLCTISNTYAQQRQAPSVDEIVANIKEDLKLTDEQVVKITPIVRNQIQQMQVIIEQAQEKVRGQMLALEQNTETKLAQCLTPEQMAKFKNKQQGSQSSQAANTNGKSINATRSGK